MNMFWKNFDGKLELCHRALWIRHKRLIGVNSNVAPSLWNYGILARLPKNSVIDPLLKNGWSTISLGYSGLYETVKALSGHSHTDETGKDLGLKIMSYMNDKCKFWKENDVYEDGPYKGEKPKLGYSIYGCPQEKTTDKFGHALQRKYGIIKGVTDKFYVTNSYHVPVFEKIDAFTKLTKEAPFQDLSSGGNISYVELPSMNKNKEALMKVIQHIYETNIYAEINTKLDHCLECGYDGEIKLEETGNGEFELECPNCGNKDARKMYVVRRLCGYLGRIDSKDNPNNPLPSVSAGRAGDIHDRVTHLK